MRRSHRLREWNVHLPAGYSSVTAATAAPHTWRVPSRTECMSCHSRQANFVLGLSELQADCSQKYDEVEMNQLRALEQQKVIDQIVPPQSPEQPRLVNPYDASQELEARARSYLHANCSPCHVEAGGGNSRIRLNIDKERDEMQLVDVFPQHKLLVCQPHCLLRPASRSGRFSINAYREEVRARCRHVGLKWSTTKPFS